jgi:hypothetical protein
VQALADDRTPFIGFRLDGPGVDSRAWLWGSATADPAERPGLQITFTQAIPEPSVPLLAGFGSAVVSASAWFRRRRATA